MRDNALHYPKEPIIFDAFPNVWKTAGTMCGKRRDIGRMTDKPESITCVVCATLARDYWTEQKLACESLLRYADTGMLKGTSAESEAETLIPKLRMALFDAIHTISLLPPVSRDEW